MNEMQVMEGDPIADSIRQRKEAGSLLSVLKNNSVYHSNMASFEMHLVGDGCRPERMSSPRRKKIIRKKKKQALTPY